MTLNQEPVGEGLTHAAIAAMVNAFYTRVRSDAQLETVFSSAIKDADWPIHLATMADFWSSIMLTSGRYQGKPMAAHLKHRDAIDPEMFPRWLDLWTETARACLAPRDAAAVIAKAERISESLQLALFFQMPTGNSQAA